MSGAREVIFVDDDPTACELLLRFGEDLPHRFLAFRDPQEALGHFEVSGADLVVTDFRTTGSLTETSGREYDLPVSLTVANTGDAAANGFRVAIKWGDLVLPNSSQTVTCQSAGAMAATVTHARSAMPWVGTKPNCSNTSAPK